MSNEGCGIECFGGHSNYTGGGFIGCFHAHGCTGAWGHPIPPNAFSGGFSSGHSSFSTAFPIRGHVQGFPVQGFPPQGPPQSFLTLPPGGNPHSPHLKAPYSMPNVPPTHNKPQPFSNTVKRFSNWNVYYSCSFDVADEHDTSMSCPVHLRKASQNIYLICQNSQQYIDLGHPCCTRNRHKQQFPPLLWWCGVALRNVAFKCNTSFYVNTNTLPNPTNWCMSIDDNDATIVTSNKSCHASTHHALLGTTLHPPSMDIITDSGAT